MPSVVNPALVTDHSVTLTGLTPATSYTFTVRSQSASGRLGTASGNFMTAALGSSPYTLTSALGSLVLTGKDAALTYAQARTIFAVVGGFGLTGITANLNKSGSGPYTLTAVPGSFVLTGEPGARAVGVSADAGTFGLAGVAANLIYNSAVGLSVVPGSSFYIDNAFAGNTVISGSLSSGPAASNRVLIFGLSTDYRDVSSITFTPNVGSPVTVTSLDIAGLYSSGLGATADSYLGHASLPTGTSFTITVVGTASLGLVAFAYDIANTSTPIPASTSAGTKGYGSALPLTIGAGQIGIVAAVTNAMGHAWSGGIADEQAGTAASFGIELIRVTASGTVAQTDSTTLLLGGVWGP